MAKQRRINRRVLILLAALAVLVIIGGLVFVYRMLPKDPLVYARKGEEALKQNDWALAEKMFDIAYNASKDPRHGFMLARVLLERAQKDPSLTDPERGVRHRRAINLLREALRLDPKYLEARQQLCDIYWSFALRGNWDDYIDEATRLLEYDPKDHLTYFRRGSCWAEKAKGVPGENTRKAIEDFHAAIKLKSDEVNYWMMLVRFLKHPSVNRPEDAEKVFQEAIKTNPHNANLYVAYAEDLYSRGQKAEALKRIQQAIESDPKSPLGKLALAQLYVRDGKLNEALKLLHEALKIDDTDVRVYRRLAGVYYRTGKLKEAAKALRDGLAAIGRRRKAETQPSTIETRRLEHARFELNYLLAGVLLDAAGRSDGQQKKAMLDEARGCLQDIRNAPRKAKIAGRIALAENKPDEALRQLELAYKGFGRHLDLQTANLLVGLYLRASPSRPGDAGTIIDRILSRNRKNITAWLMKANLEMEYRRFAEAKKAVDAAVRIDPTNKNALGIQRLLSTMLGQADEIPKNIKLTRGAVRMFLERIAILWLDGQRSEAIRLAENLHSRSPRNLTVILALANLYARNAQIPKAKRLLRKVAADMPAAKDELEFRVKLLDVTDRDKRYEMFLAQIDRTVKDDLDRALRKADLAGAESRKKDYLKYLAEAAKHKPDAPGVIERQFRVALSLSDWKTADQCVERAKKHDTDRIGGRFYEARLAFARKKYSDAIRMLLAILAKDPEARGAKVLLGQAYLRRADKGDLEKAESVFHAQLASNPGFMQGIIGMARAKEALGKWEEFAELIRQAYNQNSRDPYVVERYLALMQYENKPEKIAQIIRKREQILEQSPNDLKNCQYLARLYEQTRNPRAEDMYRYIYQRATQKVVAARLLVAYYIRTRQSSKADKVLSDLLKSTDDKVGAYALYGDFLMDLNQFSEAETMFRRAIRADAKDHRGYEGLAKLMALQAKWKEASDALENVLRLHDDLSARKVLVEYRIRANQLPEAEKQLARIVASEPSGQDTFRLKAALASRRGDYSKAEELLTLAIQEYPKFSRGYVTRSRLYRGQGELEKARRDMEEAARLTRDPSVSIELAGLLVELHKYSEAERVLRETLSRSQTVLPTYQRSQVIDLLADLYMRQKDWPPLERLLASAKKEFPHSNRYYILEARMWKLRRETGRQIAELKTALKMSPKSYVTMQEYLAALSDAKKYDDVLAIVGEYEKDPRAKFMAMAFRARALVGKNRTAEADRLFVEVLKNQDVPAGFIIRQIKDAYGPNKAIVKLSKWVGEYRSKDWRSYAGLADLIIAKKDTKALPEVLKLLERAKALAKSEDVRVRIEQRVGSVQHKLKNYRAAEKAYLTVLKLRPNDVHAMNNLAYLYANDMGRPADALSYAERVAKLRPGDANVLDTYGWTLAKLAVSDPAKWKLAQRTLELSVAQNVTAANCFHLGWLFAQRGNKAEAKRWYDRSFEIVRDDKSDPIYAELIQARKRLR